MTMLPGSESVEGGVRVDRADGSQTVIVPVDVAVRRANGDALPAASVEVVRSRRYEELQELERLRRRVQDLEAENEKLRSALHP